MYIKTIMQYHYAPITVDKMEKTDRYKGRQSCRELELTGGSVKTVWSHRKAFGGFLEIKHMCKI